MLVLYQGCLNTTEKYFGAKKSIFGFRLVESNFASQKRFPYSIGSDPHYCKYIKKTHSTYLLLFSIDGVRAKVYIKAMPNKKENGVLFVRAEETKMDFSVKNIQMGVDNVSGGNQVIRKYTFTTN